MEEIVRIESLNARGLRDQQKRLFIFDRTKERKADIILLQETHQVQDDYTDIIKDGNIKTIIAGNSRTSTGVAIIPLNMIYINK